MPPRIARTGCGESRGVVRFFWRGLSPRGAQLAHGASGVRGMIPKVVEACRRQVNSR